MNDLDEFFVNLVQGMTEEEVDAFSRGLTEAEEYLDRINNGKDLD